MGDKTVRRFEAADAPGWDDFISSHPDGTLFHTTRWRALLIREYGFSDHSLVAAAGSRISGTLPLLKVSSPFGSRLVSLPASMYGGPLADDRPTAEKLIDVALEMAAECRGGLRIRMDWPAEMPGICCVLTEQDAVISGNGPMNSEWIWDELVSSRARRDARKSERLGITARRDGLDSLPAFHDLYFSERKRLRLPAASKRHFERILTEFDGGVIWAESDDRPVAALLYLVDTDSLHYVNAASGVYGRRLHAADLLIWNLIKEASDRGVSTLHLGGSSNTNTGLRRFKRKWGALESPVYAMTTGKVATCHEAAKRRGIWMWDRLPDPVVRRAGPLLIRWFS